MHDQGMIDGRTEGVQFFEKKYQMHRDKIRKETRNNSGKK